MWLGYLWELYLIALGDVMITGDVSAAVFVVANLQDYQLWPAVDRIDQAIVLIL